MHVSNDTSLSSEYTVNRIFKNESLAWNRRYIIRWYGYGAQYDTMELEVNIFHHFISRCYKDVDRRQAIAQRRIPNSKYSSTFKAAWASRSSPTDTESGMFIDENWIRRGNAKKRSRTSVKLSDISNYTEPQPVEQSRLTIPTHASQSLISQYEIGGDEALQRSQKYRASSVASGPVWNGEAIFWAVKCSGERVVFILSVKWLAFLHVRGYLEVEKLFMPCFVEKADNSADKGHGTGEVPQQHQTNPKGEGRNQNRFGRVSIGFNWNADSSLQTRHSIDNARRVATLEGTYRCIRTLDGTKKSCVSQRYTIASCIGSSFTKNISNETQGWNKPP